MRRSNRCIPAVAGALILMVGLAGCDFDAINTDPNNPVEASLETVLPNAQMNIIFSLTGADPGWYSSVLVQHTTGVHAQLHDADQLRALTPTTLNNSWNNLYAVSLQDLNYIIEFGTERESWNYVGIAKVLMAYTFQLATDLWGRVPYSQALEGADNLKPAYDDQEAIYAGVIELLDEAIADLNRPTAATAGRFDLLYGGNADAWRRAAYSLQARAHNRLSNRDPQGSATRALASAVNGFEMPAHSLVFRGYTSTATEEHPWFQEYNDRRHHAWSQRMDELMLMHDDPRREIFAAPMPSSHAQAGEIIPAPNGAAALDQGGALYSKLSSNIIYPTAPQPLMTYAELQFIIADASRRLGRYDDARTALEEGIRAAMQFEFVGLDEASIDAYIAGGDVIPQNDAALEQRIAEEKWIALFPFQAVEAYSEWRRTGYPNLTNPSGIIPRRMPLAQREYDTNAENAPRVPLTNGVWWDDGTED